jgi:hypothetical protein
MAKVLRSDVKIDDEVIPAGTRMSDKRISTSFRKQLKEFGFFVDEAEVEEEDSDVEAQEEGSEEGAEEEAQGETEGEG